MKLKALNGQVIIRRDKSATETPQGIVLVDATREITCTGIVLAVGPGGVSELTGNRLPMETKVGDRVAFPKFAGQQVPGLEDAIVVNERELLMILDAGEEIS